MQASKIVRFSILLSFAIFLSACGGQSTLPDDSSATDSQGPGSSQTGIGDQSGGELDEFGREPQLYGMRLVFPPSSDSPNAFTLRVESFASDPRSLFLENQGSFGPTVAARGLEPIDVNIRSTYEFLVERVLPFLKHFDLRQEA